jgi:hypothetical protein
MQQRPTKGPGVPKVVDDCHDLLVWMIPQIDKLPRARRFTLGERLEAGLLEVLELLVRAAYSRERREVLAQANLRLEVLRHLWRAAYELQGIAMRQYEHGAKRMNAVGVQIGGWARAQGAA